MKRLLPLLCLTVLAACTRPSVGDLLARATWVDLTYDFDSTTTVFAALHREGTELRGPTVDQRLFRETDPRHRQRVARHREDQLAPETARLADHAARGVEHDVAQLEAVAELGEGEGIAVGHLPAARVALRVAHR